MIITLIGMMGVGKSTVGKNLSRELNWPFYDIDKIICRKTGESIPDIFSRGGNLTFRNWERKVIAQVFTDISKGIVAPGGGAVLDRQNRKLFRRGGPIFYLAADIEEILERIEFSNRPLLNKENKPENKIRELLCSRKRLYEMGHKIDTTDLTIDETICLIKENLK